MSEVNIYCDESNHLQNSPVDIMVLGAVFCLKRETNSINKEIREIKKRHGLSSEYEMKWTKISEGKVNFFIDIIDYFFCNDSLHFRGVLIDKKELNHEKFNQTHDNWYYKMYFVLLKTVLDPTQKHYIYLDIKDTRGPEKIKKLHEVLCNNVYDFKRNIIGNVQQVRSHEIEILQITDLLIGALQFFKREDLRSSAKKSVMNRIKEMSGYDLDKSTLLKESKFNIFYWEGGSSQ